MNDEYKKPFDEAERENSKRVADDLKALADSYEMASNQAELAKLSMKGVIDRGKDVGVTKGMIETFIAMRNFNAFNKMAITDALESGHEEE